MKSPPSLQGCPRVYVGGFFQVLCTLKDSFLRISLQNTWTTIKKSTQKTYLFYIVAEKLFLINYCFKNSWFFKECSCCWPGFLSSKRQNHIWAILEPAQHTWQAKDLQLSSHMTSQGPPIPAHMTSQGPTARHTWQAKTPKHFEFVCKFVTSKTLGSRTKIMVPPRQFLGSTSIMFVSQLQVMFHPLK